MLQHNELRVSAARVRVQMERIAIGNSVGVMRKHNLRAYSKKTGYRLARIRQHATRIVHQRASTLFAEQWYPLPAGSKERKRSRAISERGNNKMGGVQPLFQCCGGFAA